MTNVADYITGCALQALRNFACNFHLLYFLSFFIAINLINQGTNFYHRK